ncbi:MAG: Fic family protein [Acidimicrobiales bacterium]
MERGPRRCRRPVVGQLNRLGLLPGGHWMWWRDRAGRLPISIGLIDDAQASLFVGVDDPPQDVGKVRTHQVWTGPRERSIDEARFVPLPGDDRLKASLEALVAWTEEAEDWPPVLRAALAHCQFETLHPFGDGNGRIGRLVIVLQLLRPDGFSNRDRREHLAPLLGLDPAHMTAAR